MTIAKNNDRFMSRDPRNYKDPDRFDPTRFLGSNPELDPRAYVFGFGRRICPGVYSLLSGRLGLQLTGLNFKGAVLRKTLSF
jgi:hypothetical protein